MYSVINSNFKNYYINVVTNGYTITIVNNEKKIQITYYTYSNPFVTISIDNCDYMSIIKTLKIFYSNLDIRLLLNINDLRDFKNIEILLDDLKILIQLKYKLLILLKYTSYITLQNMDYLFIYIFKNCKPLNVSTTTPTTIIS